MRIRTALAASALCLLAGVASADILESDPDFKKEEVVALRAVDTKEMTDSSVAELQKIRVLLDQQNVILGKILKAITGENKK